VGGLPLGRAKQRRRAGAHIGGRGSWGQPQGPASEHANAAEAAVTGDQGPGAAAVAGAEAGLVGGRVAAALQAALCPFGSWIFQAGQANLECCSPRQTHTSTSSYGQRQKGRAATCLPVEVICANSWLHCRMPACKSKVRHPAVASDWEVKMRKSSRGMPARA
jgi:hypothetical protein